MKLEYVASGLAHTRINRSAELVDRLLVDPTDNSIPELNRLLKSINGRNGHSMSLLFNAYKEIGLGKTFKKVIYPGTIAEVHSDSGGLQMITLGKVPTPKLRADVYARQAELSSIAMSFDEIPVYVDGERSTRLDTSNRYFDPSVFEAKARLTGENLKDQIDHFIACKTTCKPLMIIQGNCFNTYQQWTNIILDVIGKDRIKYLGGIASGTASLGQGPLEDFKRTFYMFMIDIPEELKTKHFHLLGVGSLVRLIPLIAMARAGLVYENCTVSYDSTSHTSGLSMGNYYMNYRLDNIPKYQNAQFFKVLENINASLDRRGQGLVEADWLHRRISQPKLWSEKFDDTNGFEEYRTIFGFLTSSIDNFTSEVYNLLHDGDELDRYCASRNILKQVRSFVKCQNQADFEKWCDQLGHTLKSKAVISTLNKTPDLGGFF